MLKLMRANLSYKKTLAYITAVFLLSFLLSGCARIYNETPRTITDNDRTEHSVTHERTIINPERQAVEMVVTLYFKHEYADFLVPGNRTVQKGKQSLEELVVEEVLKGPAKFARVCIMPPNVKLLDVIRKDETVFVNLNDAFKGDVDVRALPGKQNLPDDRIPIVAAEMKRLAIYSIVNSLTEISGVQQVKILINNRSVAYNDLGLMPFAPNASNITPGSTIMPILRNSRFILNPTQVTNEFFSSLIPPFDWERAHSFLAEINADGTSRLSLEKFEDIYTAYVSEMAFEVRDEEVRHDGTAFVTADFSIKYANGERREKVNYNLIVQNENGIWRLIMPQFLLEPVN